MATLRYIKGRVKNRRDTLEKLTDTNPLLYDGELCIESDTLKFKFGDGVTRYNDLPYPSMSIPPGGIIPYAGKVIPDDYLLCNGQEVSRLDYPELFEAIGTTYGNGDGHSTFKIPDLSHLFIEPTKNESEIGTTLQAGLPNITGQFDLNDNHPGTRVINGAFYWVMGDTGYNGPKDDGDNGRAGFDASRCSPIYGRSDTVQPPAILMYYIIATG